MPLYVGTKKGLFIIDEGRWTIGRPHFLGDPVSAVLPQAQSIYAALNLGHFGVKLHRSDNRGDSWTEVATPAYPAKPDERILLAATMLAPAMQCAGREGEVGRPVERTGRPETRSSRAQQAEQPARACDLRAGRRAPLA